MTGAVPLWTYDQSNGKYKPFVENYDSSTDVYTMRNGMIGVEIDQDDDMISFFNSNGTEKRLNEDWLLLVNGTVANLSLDSWDTSKPNSTTIIHTRNYTSSEMDLSIDYILMEGKPLKHTITGNAKVNANFQLQQKWTNIGGMEQASHANKTKSVDIDPLDNSKSIDVKKDTHRFVELKDNNGNMIAHEITGRITGVDSNGDPVIKSELRNFELLPGQKTAKFHWGYWSLGAGEQFVLDPDTFTNSNPTEDATMQKVKAVSSTCDTLGRSDNDGWLFIGSTNSDSGKRTYVEWPISSIDDDATIDDVDWTWTEHDQDSPNPQQIVELSSQPSTASDSTVWDDASDGDTDNIYVDPWDISGVSAGQDKTTDLGTSADSDLENRLTSDWFAIGIDMDGNCDTSSTGRYRIDSEEGGGAQELTVTFTTPSCTPNQITDLSATTDSTNPKSEIDLSWTNPTNCTLQDTDVENLKHTSNGCSGDSSWADPDGGTVGSAVESFTHSSLSSNTCYEYRVRVQSDTGDWSAYSNQDTAVTLPGQVTGNTWTGVDPDQADGSWDNISGPEEDGYKIERRKNSASDCTGTWGSWSTIVSNTGDQTTTHSDTGLDEDSCYEYRVSAINEQGTGAASTGDTATTGVSLAQSVTDLMNETDSVLFERSRLVDISNSYNATETGLGFDTNKGILNTMNATDSQSLDVGKFQTDTATYSDTISFAPSIVVFDDTVTFSDSLQPHEHVVAAIVVKSEEIVHDVWNATLTVNVDDGVDEEITQLQIFQNGTIEKSITPDTSVSEGSSPEFGPFYVRLIGDSTSDVSNMTASFTITNVTNSFQNTTNNNVSKILKPDFQFSRDAQAQYNFTHQRSGDFKTLTLNVTRPNTDFQIECKFEEELFDDGTWSNRTNVGYMKEVRSAPPTQNVYITCFNDDQLFTTTSFGTTNGTLVLTDFTSQMGDLFGTVVPFLFIVLLASVFTGRSAATGIIIVATAIGMMGAMGFWTDADGNQLLDTETWVVITAFSALGVLGGKKFF